MMKILVGSQNPVKIEATKEAFSTYFGRVEVRGIKVDSKVSNQLTNDETFHGARNRAFGLKRINDKKILYRFSQRKSMPERQSLSVAKQNFAFSKFAMQILEAKILKEFCAL